MGPPTDRIQGKFPTWQQGCQNIYQKPQKGGAHHFQGIKEAGSRLLLRQLSPHSRVLLHTTLISLVIGHRRLCPAGLRTSPALLPTGSRGPSLQDADNSLAQSAVSWTHRLRLWYSGSLSPCRLFCVCYISLRLSECV